MTMSSRDRRALLIGAGVVLAAVVYRVALSPAVAVWSEARQAVIDHESVIDRVDVQIDRREAIHARLRERFGPAIDRPLPMLEDVQVAFPKVVRDAMGKGGAQPGSVDIQGVRKLRDVPGVSLVTLRVNAVCDANAIPAVLDGLRTADRIVIIDAIELSMAQPGNRSKWTMTLQLSTPALEPPQS